MQKIKLFFLKLKYRVKKAWRRFEDWLSALFGGKQKSGTLFDNTRETSVRPDAGTYQDGETRLFTPVNGEEYAQEEQEEALFTERGQPRPFVLSILFSSVKLMLLLVALLGFGVLGAAVGIAKAYVETTPTLDRAQLTKSDRTSYLYDKDGNLITSIADIEYRDWVDIENIPARLTNAFVAVEDVRFYKHEGVDIKRLMKAAIEVLGNSNSSGGSTITQQLIKNKVLTAERNYKRKIQEAYLALELEKEINKDDILEAYLNDIHLGGSNYGVKTAAKDYFNKELNELTIKECAMLAGLTQNPYRYNPRLNKYSNGGTNWKYTEDRTNTVLMLMYKNGFITQQEYEAAKAEDVYIVEISHQKQMYQMPHFVEYAIHDVVTHLLQQRGLPDTNVNRNTVENELRTGGYRIYTTLDPKIQNTVQETLETWEKYPPLANPDKGKTVGTLSDNSVIETVQPQASAVVLDYRKGELRAVVGSRTTPIIRKSLNRARQSYMEVGSSIKPLAVYGPALDAGVSPATVIANLAAPISGWGTEQGYPAIGNSKWVGPVTVRRGIVSSLNVVAARTLFEYVSPEVAAEYLVNMGAITSEINVDGPGLALGTSGLTTIQMAGAFGTIAGGGEYKEPLSFTKVVDGAGNIILDAEAIRVRRQVFLPSTAWLLVDMLQDAVDSGTGTNAKIKGMSVAGKTGTNADNKSVYFAGMTPYYVGTIWIGHDQPSNPLKSGSSGGTYAAPVWQAFMSKIHTGLSDRNIIDASVSELGLVKKTVCSVSGLLATDACAADSDGHEPVEDWFLYENAPTEFCDMHVAVHVCSETGQLATEDCPASYVTSGAQVLIRPGNYYDQFTDEQLATGFTMAVRTSMTLEEYESYLAGARSVCALHGGGSEDGGDDDDSALEREARELGMKLDEIIANESLSQSESQQLRQLRMQISNALSAGRYQQLETAMEKAKEAVSRYSDDTGEAEEDSESSDDVA